MVTIKQANKIVLHIARNRAKNSLSLSHYAVLAHLYNSSRYCSVMELCESCGLSYHQTVICNKGSVLDVLVKKELVQIVNTQGSKSHYSITRLGRETLERECLSVRDYLNDLLFT